MGALRCFLPGPRSRSRSQSRSRFLQGFLRYLQRGIRRLWMSISGIMMVLLPIGKSCPGICGRWR